jgi:hypothetical protein
MRITPGAVGTVTLVGGIDAEVQSGDVFTSSGPVTVGNTATLVQAAAVGNITVIMKASKNNSKAIYIGDSGLTDPSVTEDGVPLDPGEALTLDTAAAVYAIAESNQTLYVSVVSRT